MDNEPNQMGSMAQANVVKPQMEAIQNGYRALKYGLYGANVWFIWHLVQIYVMSGEEAAMERYLQLRYYGYMGLVALLLAGRLNGTAKRFFAPSQTMETQDWNLLSLEEKSYYRLKRDYPFIPMVLAQAVVLTFSFGIASIIATWWMRIR